MGHKNSKILQTSYVDGPFLAWYKVVTQDCCTVFKVISYHQDKCRQCECAPRIQKDISENARGHVHAAGHVVRIFRLFEMHRLRARSKVTRWQNLRPPPQPWRNPTKGRDQILQHSGAIVLQAQSDKHSTILKNLAIAIWHPWRVVASFLIFLMVFSSL